MTRNQKCKGFTLIEVFIVTVLVFVFFSAIIGIIKTTQKSMIRTLNAAIIQADIRHANADILKNLNSSTWSSFVGSAPKGIYYFGDDARHPLLIQSALNDDGTMYTDKDMIPHLKKYVLYFIIRPPGDTCFPVADYSQAPAMPAQDVYCPHKLLIRKEIKSYVFSPYSTIGLGNLKFYLTADLKDTIYDSIISQKIMAENVLDFTITLPAEILPGSGAVIINYNGSPKNAASKILSCGITAFKDKKYFARNYSNENLLNEKENLFSLTSSAEPTN